jgi:hypothetical protein
MLAPSAARIDVVDIDVVRILNRQKHAFLQWQRYIPGAIIAKD